MNAQTKIQSATLAKLREPFADNHISKLPKPTKAQTDAVKQDFKKGVRCKQCGSWHHPDVVHLDYVGHAALTDRLLDTDLEWSWEPVAFTEQGLPAFDQTGGLWIKLTVLGVTRLGYGHAANKPNADPGSREKEVIGDALRNAAMRFGAALDLWHKGDLHRDDDSASGGSERDNSEARQVSPTGPAKFSQGDTGGRITDDQLAKLQTLLKATSIDAVTFCRMMNAPEGAQVFQLPQSRFAAAVEMLEAKLAEMAKVNTNSNFGEILDDEIIY